MNDVKGFGNLCKNHSARSEKEFCRVCPSKLNKKELEDVYFSLLENNLDLKQTINSQREKIKVLSTKIQRLTAVQKTYLGKEPKECCGSKAVILEQKECILELQRSNQCLSERFRQLNMRLCSAKQFLKRSPFQSASRCNRCSNKTASMSALITKRSESNLRTAVASSQYLDKDIMSSRTADQEIVSHEKGVQYDFCEENKCRTHIEELKQKNENLEELLSKIRDDLASRTSQHEAQAAELRAENLRVRAQRTQSEDSLKLLKEECIELTNKLGMTEIRCDELSVELSIEKRKVLELEMRVKAADMSSRIANAIEAHLSSIKMVNNLTNFKTGGNEPVSQETSVTVQESPRLAVSSPRNIPKPAVRTKVSHLHVEEAFKNSDDSGYTEVNRSSHAEEKASTYLNQVLLEKIADLQNQINNLKISKGYSSVINIEDTADEIQSKINKTIHNYKILSEEKNAINSTFDENIISESSESVVTEKNLNAFSITKERVQNIENKEDFENKAQATSSPNVDSTKETTSKNKISNELSKGSQVQTNSNVSSNRRESFKEFRKRSKDKSRDVNNVTDTRKLSLESSRSFAERNFIKTGSLDENRVVNVDNNSTSIDNFAVNVIEPMTDKNIQDNVQSQEIKQGDTFKKTGKETTYLNANIHINNSLSDNGHDKEIINKDSDSSKGTYSIHKDETLKNTANKDLVQDKEQTTPNDKTKVNKYESFDILIGSKKKAKYSGVSKGNVLEKRRSSTTSQPRTCILPGKGKTKSSRELSPDSTECEISSLSDLPSERDERTSCKYRSPGEERLTTTVSESRTDTTTDYGSLSEGELPFVGDATSLSAGETRLAHTTMKSHSLPMSTSKQMEEALAMVKEELSRCTNLLRVHTRRSLDRTHRVADHV